MKNVSQEAIGVSFFVATFFIFGTFLLLSPKAAWSQVVADDVICTNCVESTDLSRNAVTAATIRNNAITRRKIRNKAVTSSKLADDAVYSRTLIVGLISKNRQPNIKEENGLALLEALEQINEFNRPRPTAANRWLIKIEPGVYDIGQESLALIPFVDIEGSGVLSTRIESKLPGSFGAAHMPGDVEIRFLMIENTEEPAAGAPSSAISLEGNGNRLNNVRLISLGGSGEALSVDAGEEVLVHSSELIGTTSATVDGVANIISSQLDGPVSGAGANCIGSYDGNFSALNANCN